MDNKITRRSFLGFFLVSGFVSLFFKKFRTPKKEKQALYWRKKHDNA